MKEHMGEMLRITHLGSETDVENGIFGSGAEQQG